ncbi:MAG: PTS sugar transporter subunit IIA [Leptotrichiaceae bacterium]|nr:PTS sugar transporter subunit IIA [Leptotrichiaceae bacterium]
MLETILKNNMIIMKKIETWEESIRTAASPLLEKNKIRKSYVEAMINDIKKMGFYVVITDKVAMPHSRPENGVEETSMSLLKLDTPVKYGEQDVYLIFILAARNKGEHIGILKDLSEFLDKDEEIENILNARTVDEIEEILKNGRR